MPITLRGEIPEESNPAGTASASAARIPGFQLMELASRGVSGQRSDAGGTLSPSDAYTSCGRPHVGQKQLSAGTAWWQRLQVTSMMFQAYRMGRQAVQRPFQKLARNQRLVDSFSILRWRTGEWGNWSASLRGRYQRFRHFRQRTGYSKASRCTASERRKWACRTFADPHSWQETGILASSAAARRGYQCDRQLLRDL